MTGPSPFDPSIKLPIPKNSAQSMEAVLEHLEGDPAMRGEVMKSLEGLIDHDAAMVKADEHMRELLAPIVEEVHQVHLKLDATILGLEAFRREVLTSLGAPPSDG